jgi:predicted transcriptional regulator of viral defense system
MSDLAAILDGVGAELVPDSSRLAGIVTAGELVAAGLSWPRLRGLVRRGVLVPLGWGVYAPAAPAATAARGPAGEHALRAAAALAAVGPVAVASHHSAALIHGLDLFGKPAAAVAVTRPPGADGSRTARPGISLHIAALPAGHVTVRSGVPVTSVARTVVDLARTSSFPAGVTVTDSALRDATVSEADLHAVLTTCGRWPGIQRARQVVAFSDARSESVLESISRVAFHDQGLPPPVLQAWVGDAGEVIGRADFLWRFHRTIGEADGAIKYADPSRAMAQLHRDARLRQAGFEVVHFTWYEIIREPDQVAASIRAAFRRRAAA